jgi:hypothetical protein
LDLAWYNFCQLQMTLKTTPVGTALLADEFSTIERLFEASARAIGARRR